MQKREGKERGEGETNPEAVTPLYVIVMVCPQTEPPLNSGRSLSLISSFSSSESNPDKREEKTHEQC